MVQRFFDNAERRQHVGRDVLGDLYVLKIDAGHAVQFGRDRTPHLGGRALRDRFQRRAVRLGPAGDHLFLNRRNIAEDLGADDAGMDGIGGDTRPCQALRKPDGVQYVGALGLGIGGPVVVFAVREIEIVELETRHPVAVGTEHQHARRRGGLQRGNQQVGEQKRADMIGREMQFSPLGG